MSIHEKKRQPVLSVRPSVGELQTFIVSVSENVAAPVPAVTITVSFPDLPRDIILESISGVVYFTAAGALGSIILPVAVAIQDIAAAAANVPASFNKLPGNVTTSGIAFWEYWTSVSQDNPYTKLPSLRVSGGNGLLMRLNIVNPTVVPAPGFVNGDFVEVFFSLSYREVAL